MYQDAHIKNAAVISALVLLFASSVSSQTFRGRVQGIGYLNAQIQSGRHIQRLSVQVVFKSLAIQELHHEERMAGRFADVVNRANIWMVQRRCGMCFALEAFSGSIRCECLGQNFDCDVTIEPRVARLIDLSHAALPDGTEDFVWTELIA